jgi:hypothetical protein
LARLAPFGANSFATCLILYATNTEQSGLLYSATNIIISAVYRKAVSFGGGVRRIGDISLTGSPPIGTPGVTDVGTPTDNVVLDRAIATTQQGRKPVRVIVGPGTIRKAGIALPKNLQIIGKAAEIRVRVVTIVACNITPQRIYFLIARNMPTRRANSAMLRIYS